MEPSHEAAGNYTHQLCTIGGQQTAMPSHDEAKVAKLTEANDIEAYLTTFEWLVATYDIEKGR